MQTDIYIMQHALAFDGDVYTIYHHKGGLGTDILPQHSTFQHHLAGLALVICNKIGDWLKLSVDFLSAPTEVATVHCLWYCTAYINNNTNNNNNITIIYLISTQLMS